MTPHSLIVPAKPRTATMRGDYVLSTLRMFSFTARGIIHSLTTMLAVSMHLPNSLSVAESPKACNAGGGPENCQINIVDLEGTLSNINIYCLSTVGATNMISEAGSSLAVYSANVNVYVDTIALFQLAAGSGGSGTSPTTTSSVPTTLSTSTRTSSPTGWTFLGCYTDNVAARTLVNGEAVPGGASAMTVEACQSTCLGLGYSLAGVEYADECCKYPKYAFRPMFLTTLQIAAIPFQTVGALLRTETLCAIWHALVTLQRHVEVPIDWIYTPTAAEPHLQQARQRQLQLPQLRQLDGTSEAATLTTWLAELWVTANQPQAEHLQ
jgi:hypothetical protein